MQDLCAKLASDKRNAESIRANAEGQGYREN